ncbi:MAG TPA: ATP-binding cassette domain-containing protein [Anaeromyxobacteraceae bacterium]|jgi:branched-chain amino acid transport system ATP-binding protein
MLLQVERLMVFFENALAVNDLSLEVAAGEIRGVVGSNGAGKTTLLNAISGLLAERRIREQRRGGERITVMGSVKLDGEEIGSARPPERVRRGLVLCRERHPIFPESSVLENLRIAGYLRTRAEVRETREFVFDLFPNLALHRRKHAGFLSGGEQQMLAIGMALVARPRLLLLDEPLLGLSPLMQALLVQSIARIRRERGTTVLIAEQFARPLLPLLDHAYVVESGLVTLSGKGPELMANPEVRAAYLGV